MEILYGSRGYGKVYYLEELLNKKDKEIERLKTGISSVIRQIEYNPRSHSKKRDEYLVCQLNDLLNKN